MRGKEFYQPYEKAAVGITPAYAGKRLSSARYMRYRQDHPRLCGEKLTARSIISSTRGSPPPMRGKVSAIMFTTLSQRITPAYAGKSVPPDGLKINIRDHPRLCGEKEFSFAASVLSTGSPPPMRGKGVAADTMIDVTRITPAYAGKRIDACDALSVQ